MNEDRVFAKCAWRLVPFMALLYLVNFIDRTNVGFAALTMNRDLGFSPEVLGTRQRIGYRCRRERTCRSKGSVDGETSDS